LRTKTRERPGLAAITTIRFLAFAGGNMNKTKSLFPFRAFAFLCVIGKANANVST
jgi:hypothetical protein